MNYKLNMPNIVKHLKNGIKLSVVIVGIHPVTVDHKQIIVK